MTYLEDFFSSSFDGDNGESSAFDVSCLGKSCCQVMYTCLCVCCVCVWGGEGLFGDVVCTSGASHVCVCVYPCLCVRFCVWVCACGHITHKCAGCAVPAAALRLRRPAGESLPVKSSSSSSSILLPRRALLSWCSLFPEALQLTNRSLISTHTHTHTPPQHPPPFSHICLTLFRWVTGSSRSG